jgi:hypothetical protein
LPNLFLDEVVLDADLAEAYTIIRSNGKFVMGGWQDTKTTIPGFGVVTVARPNEIQMLPEGDRNSEVRAFYSAQPLYETRDNPQEGTGVSDILVWNGFKYRVMVVPEYGNRGYWKAIAAKMSAA